MRFRAQWKSYALGDLSGYDREESSDYPRVKKTSVLRHVKLYQSKLLNKKQKMH